MTLNSKPARFSDVSVPELASVSLLALGKLGLSESDAQTVLRVLMYGQLRGSSQGLIKIVERTVVPAPDATTIEQSQVLPALLHIKANGNAGMVVLSHACNELIELAPRMGIAAASTVGTASSTGAIGYYAGELAKAGLVGIVMAGSPKSTALFGGTDPLIGTNPIALAMPSAGEPLTIDFASAASTVFDLIAARENADQIESGLAYDATGKPTTDPAAALDGGAIKTFGEAKGSALGLMIELLTGALSGASLPGDPIDSRGNLLIAIDPAATVGTENLRSRVQQMIEHITQSRSVEPGMPVRIPGSGSAARARQAQASGKTSVDSGLWQQLNEIANQ
jgi:LDH2 family malate/lactate/ureidoglycolate dehydrogenase